MGLICKVGSSEEGQIKSVFRFNLNCRHATAKRFSCVLGMLNSLEVKVLYPT